LHLNDQSQQPVALFKSHEDRGPKDEKHMTTSLFQHYTGMKAIRRNKRRINRQTSYNLFETQQVVPSTQQRENAVVVSGGQPKFVVKKEQSLLCQLPSMNNLS